MADSDSQKIMMKDAFWGKHAHVDPKKVLENLNLKDATHKPSPQAHSGWDLLFHLVCWQDASLKGIREEIEKWPEPGKDDWPDSNLVVTQDSLDEMKKQFLSGIEGAIQLIDEFDMNSRIPSWYNITVAQALMVLVLHNSYHLGQIVTLLRQAGSWPIPK